MSMTSRERVVAALEHREPDRVPIAINAVKDCYLNLKSYLGLDTSEAVKPNVYMEVILHPKVLTALGADLTSVKLGSPKGFRPANRGDLIVDEWGIGRRLVFQPGGGSLLEVAYHPLADCEDIDDLAKYAWPDPSAPGRGEGAAAEAKRLAEDTDLALVGRFGGPIVETALYLMGYERWLMCCVTEPGLAGALLDKITEIQIALDRIGLEATGQYLQIFKVSGEDLGMQTGPLYSPKIFRRLLLPRLRRRWQAARECLDRINPSVRLMLHSCGGIRPFIADLIQAGIQVLDPVQPRAAGMDSHELKQEFGERLTFHGGIDEQHVLPFGSAQEVASEVRLRIQAFGRGGGYILAPSHTLQADTPPGNIVAMCQAAREYGQYPISS